MLDTDSNGDFTTYPEVGSIKCRLRLGAEMTDDDRQAA